ncbi:MAG: ImmA/IrrE family metallo-endopeptidase [Deltaproteobacteria bacterium]|nr:ImmA/IrrE family metallo-endopeptidase [Deltaproteobacteria bacterium]
MDWHSRLAILKERSATFRKLFGSASLSEADIANVFDELCMVDAKGGSLYDERVLTEPTPFDDPDIWRKSFIAVDLVSALRSEDSSIRRVYYIFINQKYIKEDKRNARWFLMAHELGHYCLHKTWIEFDRVIDSNAIQEEEADFFARLCFWPLNKIADDIYEKGKAENIRYTREDVINHLVEYLEQKGISTSNRPKIQRIAFNFLLIYEKELPDNYKSFAARVFPSI